MRARQASEQYLTCSQFLAQALRQLMGRPQTAQGLLGRWALLPLKSFCTRRFYRIRKDRARTGASAVLRQRLADLAALDRGAWHGAGQVFEPAAHIVFHTQAVHVVVDRLAQTLAQHVVVHAAAWAWGR